MFDNYCSRIKKLNTFNKEDILNEDFELYNEGNMRIYYAPHNEIINDKAKVFIVGITPGWTQTSIAYKTANNGLLEGKDFNQIKMECKRNSRFTGSMRKNIIEMLDELHMNNKLHLDSCARLFKDMDHLLHTTSLVPYPVFINNKNYTGSSPKIMENEILYDYVKNYFYKEASILSDALIIPLGKAVEEILIQMIKENLLKNEQCLLGFPHPSGANGHRKRQFQENKKELMAIIDNFFSR